MDKEIVGIFTGIAVQVLQEEVLSFVVGSPQVNAKGFVFESCFYFIGSFIIESVLFVVAGIGFLFCIGEGAVFEEDVKDLVLVLT